MGVEMLKGVCVRVRKVPIKKEFSTLFNKISNSAQPKNSRRTKKVLKVKRKHERTKFT